MSAYRNLIARVDRHCALSKRIDRAVDKARSPTAPTLNGLILRGLELALDEYEKRDTRAERG